MDFHIEKIVLWRADQPEKFEYEFMPGVVNVITGDKQTGRTSFVNIINYVFGSKDCELPDRFMPVVGWVGAVVGIGTERWLVARELTTKRTSPKCHLSQLHGTDEVPLDVDTNIKCDALLKRLDNMVCGEFKMDGADVGAPMLPKLEFRDVLHFSFQDENTITNRRVLVNGFENGATRNKILEYLPFIFGVETREIVQLRNKKTLMGDEYESKLRLRARMEEVSKAWAQELALKLRRASELKIYPPNIPMPDGRKVDDLVFAAREFLKYNEEPRVPQIDAKADSRYLEKINSIQVVIKKCANDALDVEAELSRLDSTQRRIREFIKTSKKTTERLEIYNWFSKYWSSSNCFFGWSGSESRERIAQNMADMKAALENFSSSAASAERVNAFEEALENERGKLRKRREKIAESHAKASAELLALRKTHDAVEGYVATQQKAAELVGEVKSAVDLTERLADSEVSLDDLTAMRREIDRLDKEIEKAVENAKKLLQDIQHGVEESIEQRLRKLYVEEDIKSEAVHVNLRDLEFGFRAGGRKIRKLVNIGSSANHTCFHIAFASALQEQFSKNQDSPVLNFVIFDCPGSGVDEKNSDGNRAYAAVRAFLESIAASKNAPWQPILMWESATPLFEPGNSLGVHVVAHFAYGSGIVPKKWFE